MSMNQSPDTWEHVHLSDIFEIQYGKGLPKRVRESTGTIDVYGSNGVVGKHALGLTRGATIIIGRKGTVGAAHLSEDVCWPIDTTYYVDFFPAELPPTYWYYCIYSLNLGRLESSSAIPGINRNDIYQEQVALPPLNEQRRIVDKLDQILPRVKACQERLDKIPIILKRFRQSVLAAACSGRLTADWGGLNQENPAWLSVEFGSLINEMKNGLSPRPNINPPGTPILRISAVRPGILQTDDVRYFQDSNQSAAYLLQPEDLLFTRYNGSLEYLGICAMVRDLPSEGKLLYPDKLIRVRVKRQLCTPQYCELFFNSPDVHGRVINKAKSSAGQNGISGKDLKAVLVNLPPLEEQHEIVRRVEALFKIADSIESRYESVRASVDKLTQSILAKAFRGELVTQDPNDEPASVLLERIRKERLSRSGTTKKRTVKKYERRGSAKTAHQANL